MPVQYILITQKSAPASRTAGEPVTYARTCINKQVDTSSVARKLARRSTIHIADVHAVLHGLAEILSEELQNGNQVHLDGIGKFRLSATGTSVPVSSGDRPPLPRNAKVLFQSSPEIKHALRNVQFRKKHPSTTQ
jgi:predicted histone-like DNA-binding protein